MRIMALALVAVLVLGGFSVWAKRRDLPSLQRAPAGEGERHVSLLAEAVAYVGIVLILAGVVATVSQQWSRVPYWGQVLIFLAAAALFLVAGIVASSNPEPALQRMVDVVWFLSVGCVAGAVGFGLQRSDGPVLVLLVGIVTSGYAAALWMLRTRAVQQAALFAGLVVTDVGAVLVAAGTRPPAWLALGLTLWGLGLVWSLLGWQQYVEPLWAAMGAGVVLTLVAPALSLDAHGWVYAVAFGTAAAAMAVSVPLRNAPLLAVGTVAMFGYLTSLVVRYFGDSLGVPAALSITGVLILALAATAGRLLRLARPAGDRRTDGRPTHRDLPKAS